MKTVKNLVKIVDMELWFSKLIALILIFFVQATFVHLPIKVHETFNKTGQTGAKVLRLMQCFGGGVFLGIYLLIMAPEVNDLIRNSMLIPYKISYPIAELTTGVGFFMVLFMESAIINIHKKLQVADNVQQTPSISKNIKINQTEITVVESVSHDNNESNNQFRSIFFQIALSLHCIFEGMAVGLKRSHTDIWTLTGAICVHEIVVAFCLGLNLHQVFSGNLKKFILFGVLHSLDIPVGVAIGTAITSVNGDQLTVNLINGILQGLASGIFIYVTFFEILYGILNHMSPLGHLVVTLTGFGVMTGLRAIP